MINDRIRDELFSSQDLKYRDFQAKLMPNVSIDRIIGVRNPIVRKMAKAYIKDAEIFDFLNTLPHTYYEEYNLHGLLIAELKDYAKTIEYMDALLPYIDNWATCDIISPKSFKKNRELLKHDIERWIHSDKTYTIRFGIEMLMSHFLDEDFDEKLLDKVAVLRSSEYYVNMMIAWFFATALSKQWDSTLPYITEKRLDTWTHNKTIQKAVESYRITAEQKEYLKSLKIK